MKMRKMTIISCKVILCKMKDFFLFCLFQLIKCIYCYEYTIFKDIKIGERNRFLEIGFFSCEQDSVPSSAVASLVFNLWINNCRRIVHRFSRIVIDFWEFFMNFRFVGLRFCSRQLWTVRIFRVFSWNSWTVGVFYEFCALLTKFNEMRELFTKFHEMCEFLAKCRFSMDFFR
jgi:hypothetical protein